MFHYVYIIYSPSSNIFYKGYSLDPQKRLLTHNNGSSRYTKNHIPWSLVYIQSFDNKRDALIREKRIKKYSKTQVETLIKSPLNEI